jgi:hypothetical protein
MTTGMHILVNCPDMVDVEKRIEKNIPLWWSFHAYINLIQFDKVKTKKELK